ncbi:hypothetical protein CCR75_004225 [Bremia lactucae]|uniref:Uncharacterized protein n=1 Tax=Bremia lactucae TaxID=4779 RepID=A0A976FPX0_BRELC|nr:hypothetical protein CCR75_004225 [Bremia lactucae]
MVSTLDSESSDPGSNPGRTLQCAATSGAKQSSPRKMDHSEDRSLFTAMVTAFSRKKDRHALIWIRCH